MLVLRRLAPFVESVQPLKRFYAHKTVTTFDAKMKQVHQETLRYISPNACVKIDSDIFIKVSSADPHQYPNSDALIAELHGGPEKNCTASMEVRVSDDYQHVDVNLKKLVDTTDFHCELAVPIKATLNITSRNGVIIHNTFGDELKVKATFINTENVRAKRIDLLCSEGNINCRGVLLGKETFVETQNTNIKLDKLEGDRFTCKTSGGNISTKCIYVESSKFETNTGCLDLQNVHKKTAVYVHQKGDLKMTGVHGNLSIFINEGTMNLQLSELEGENTIQANNLSSSVINISDNIEKNTLVEVNLSGDSTETCITLDKTLEHLSSALDANKQHLQWSYNQNPENKLMVSSKSSLTMGKSSWLNMMRLKISKKQNIES